MASSTDHHPQGSIDQVEGVKEVQELRTGDMLAVLPTELLVDTLSYLTIQEILRNRLVSRSLRDLIDTNELELAKATILANKRRLALRRDDLTDLESLDFIEALARHVRYYGVPRDIDLQYDVVRQFMKHYAKSHWMASDGTGWCLAQNLIDVHSYFHIRPANP